MIYNYIIIGWLTFISWSQIDILYNWLVAIVSFFLSFFLRAYLNTNTLLTRLNKSMSITPTVGEIETWLLVALGGLQIYMSYWSVLEYKHAGHWSCGDR